MKRRTEIGEYKAAFGFNEVATFKKALNVYKAILEAQAGSAYELTHNTEYKRVCITFEEVEKKPMNWCMRCKKIMSSCLTYYRGHLICKDCKKEMEREEKHKRDIQRAR